MLDSSSDDAALVTEQRLGDHILLVSLNRAQKLNATNAELAEAIGDIVRRNDADPEILVVLLASSRERAFCAGADIGAINLPTVSGDLKAQQSRGGFSGFVDALRLKPWIAMVEGLAFGGGCEICLACDMMVASEKGRFAVPEVKRSFVAGAGGVHRLHQVLPRNVAQEMVATGEPIHAAPARAYGMVNRLTPARRALAEARVLAEQIAIAAPFAVQRSLAAAHATLKVSEEYALSIVADAAAYVRGTDDYREGIRAFMEKRSANWSAR